MPQSLDLGTVIEELLLIWLAPKASEWENRIEWLPLQIPGSLRYN